MTHDYTFNFGFLQKWMDANPSITKLQVMQILHSSDYNAFNRWYRGEMPLPLSHILCLCNNFCIPLESFFFDNNAPASIHIPAPTVDDQTEPTCGWIHGIDKGRGRRFFDPHAENYVETTIPQDEPILQIEDAPTEETTRNTTADTSEPKISNAEIEAMLLKRENEVRQECALLAKEERIKMIEAIANQSSQIAEMSRMLYRADPYQPNREYKMASEGLPTV